MTYLLPLAGHLRLIPSNSARVRGLEPRACLRQCKNYHSAIGIACVYLSDPFEIIMFDLYPSPPPKPQARALRVGTRATPPLSRRERRRLTAATPSASPARLCQCVHELQPPLAVTVDG